MNNNNQPNSGSSPTNRPTLGLKVSKLPKEPGDIVSEYVVTLYDARLDIGRETRFSINEAKMRDYKKNNPGGLTREMLLLKMVCECVERLSASIEDQRPKLILPR